MFKEHNNTNIYPRFFFLFKKVTDIGTCLIAGVNVVCRQIFCSTKFAELMAPACRHMGQCVSVLPLFPRQKESPVGLLEKEAASLLIPPRALATGVSV